MMDTHRRTPLASLTPWERGVEWGFYGLLAAMPLMLGTVTTRAPFMAAARGWILLLLLVFVVQAWCRRRDVQTVSLTAGWLWLMAMAAWMLVPLPVEWIARLDPARDGLFRRALDAWGLYDGWRALAVDPVETAAGLSGVVCLAGVFVLAGTLFSARHRLLRLVTALAVIGFAQALLAFLQKALGLTSIYGTVAIPGDAPFLFGTFVNPNHQAAFFCLIIPLQWALALKADLRSRRWLWIVAALITASALFLTLSRGGVLAFLIGQLLMVALLWRKRSPRWHLVGPLLTTLLAAAAASFLALRMLGHEASTLQEPLSEALGPKPWIWADTWRLIGTLPVFGTGVEGFKHLYPLFKTTRIDQTVLYPENIPLQLFAEWGVIVGGVWLCLILVWIGMALKDRRLSRMEIGIVTGILSVFLHDFCDFSLTAFAVAVPMAALGGALTLRLAQRRPPGGFFSAFHVPTIGLIAFAAMALLVVPLAEGAWLLARPAAVEYDLHTVLTTPGETDATQREAASAAMRAHPFDAYLRLLVAERLGNAGPSGRTEGLLLLREAKRLDPTSPLVDRLSGTAYARAGRKAEALAAFREALAKDVELRAIFEDMRLAGLGPLDLVRALPARPDRVWALANYLMEKREWLIAAELVHPFRDAAAPWGPRLEAVRGRLYLVRGDLKEAERVGGEVARRFPEYPEGYVLLGEADLRQGRPEGALVWFEKALATPGMSTDFDLLWNKAQVLRMLKRPAAARDVALRLHTLARTNPQRRQQAFMLMGDLALDNGEAFAAKREFEQALEAWPDHIGPWRRLGDLAYAAGDVAEAIRCYEQEYRLGVREAALENRLNECRARLHPGAPRR